MALQPEFPHYQGFTITLRHTTLRRIPLRGWSARNRDIQHSQVRDIHDPRQDSNPQSHQASVRRPNALYHAATGICSYFS